MLFKKWTNATPLVAVILLAMLYFSLQEPRSLLVSTTTSLYDSGLLDALGDAYEKMYGEKIRFVPVGTGQALEYARRGDVDAVFVHAPTLEAQVIQENVCGVRKIVAYNFFTIIGPASDPAGVNGLSTTQALERIAETESTWVSRGDNSGTNVKEKELWKLAGYDYETLKGGGWFVESGSGMGATLRVANEEQAYTLSDIGTYLKYRSENIIQLEPMVDEGQDLLNVYSAMAVNPSMHPDVKFDGAVEFIRFLVSETGQGLIENFGRYKYGQSLFHPAVEVMENESSEIGGWIRGYAFIDNSECPPIQRFGREDLYE